MSVSVAGGGVRYRVRAAFAELYNNAEIIVRAATPYAAAASPSACGSVT